MQAAELSGILPQHEANSMIKHLPDLSIRGIIAIEPRVGRLLQSAADLRAQRRTDWHDYTAYKRRLSNLVGDGAQDDRLGTPEVYERAIVALTEALGL